MADRRANREDWQKRVDRWKESGLTAKEFAAEAGINAGTLQFWRYKLRKGQSPQARRRPTRVAEGIVSSIVEVRPTAAATETRFEVELGNGRRLRVPPVFESSTLKTLLAVLEATS